MESDLQHHHHHHHHQEQNSGLMRYRSAPSSYFTEMLDREFCQQFFNRPSSPETERIFARFMNSGDDDFVLDPPKHTITNPNPNPNPSQSANNNINNNSASRATGFYQSASKPPLPTSSVGEGAYSMGMNSPQFPPMRTGGVATSGLVRHSSSPAGLFANINIDSVMGELTGFGAMRGMGTYGGGGGNNNNSSGKLEDASFMPASPSLKRTSSMGPMSPIAENDDKANNYASSFTIGSWDDIPDNITDLKRIRDDEDVKPFSGLNNNTTHENQNAEAGNRPPMLAHHLSLPKTQSEMAAIEKFLQFRDSVPCKIRAKRGCATHPRSIAERVRRTRISERMRKLQDLVPNMEKQTNTADMLDLAVEYIKDLQNQVQTLDDIRAKCTCSNKQQKQQ